MRRSLLRIAVGCLLILFLWPLSGEIIGLPRYLQVTSGNVKKLTTWLPVAVDVKNDDAGDVVAVTASARRYGSSLQSTLTLSGLATGESSLVPRLFGVLTLPSSRVEVLPPVLVAPGGDAIGVLLAPFGVIVKSFATVPGLDGKRHQPARDAGLREGDNILAINGEPVFSSRQISSLINGHGRLSEIVRLRVRRGAEELEIPIAPVPTTLAGEERAAAGAGAGTDGMPVRYLIGVNVEDPAAGVGTVTFYDLRTGIYGALGHQIVDQATRKPRDVSQATVVRAQIAGVERGKQGRPGEKIGAFRTGQAPLGRIARNTEYGIFGRISAAPRSWMSRSAIPVALADEVHEGPATIRTVLAGERVEEFAVEITRVQRQRRPSTKGLVVHVNDQRLFDATGGIVQGMSGSPIIQDGKLAGAVTHVFVNDPRQGYGVLAEWMVKAAGLFEVDTGVVAWEEGPEWMRASLPATGVSRPNRQL